MPVSRYDAAPRFGQPGVQLRLERPVREDAVAERCQCHRDLLFDNGVLLVKVVLDHAPEIAPEPRVVVVVGELAG